MTASVELMGKLLVRKADAAAMFGITEKAFMRRVNQGRYPQPIYIGRIARWRVSDLQLILDNAAIRRQRERMPRSISPRPGASHLYRHFDASGALLYVGISLSAIQRLGDHAKAAHWFWSIVRVEITAYPDRETALKAERIAIRNEKPLYNIALVCREAA
jgi:predicted DNA-binding transcriptional regulator AlpA